MSRFENPAGRLVHPVDFGAFLYTPATHPSLTDVVRGRNMQGASAICVCLEDAILDTEVETAWSRLRSVLEGLEDLDPERRPLLFVRPRNLEMAARFAQEDCHIFVDGVVAPKITPTSALRWAQALFGTRLLMMPTLETKEVFDTSWQREMAHAIISEVADRTPLVRIGANDLLSCLGLRREADETLYEGPLGSVVSNLVTTFVPMGLRLAAPVFEYSDRIDTLAREVSRDLAFGLCGKTAIHPGQVPVIQAALRVDPKELESARLILAPDAPAVFKNNGAMCEPATHRRWAANLIARADRWGSIDAPSIQIAI